MSEASRQAKLYFEQCKADLKTAKKFFRSDNHEKCALMSVQAVSNCLSSICLSMNRVQNPTYNMTDMLKICANKYEEFSELSRTCEEMDSIQDYKLFDKHVKGGKKITQDETKSFLDNATKLIKHTEKIIKQYKILPLPLLGL